MKDKSRHRHTFILSGEVQHKLETLSNALGRTKEEVVAQAISELDERIDTRSTREERGTVRMTEEQVRHLLDLL
jgi:predicted DNA-binding protein